MVSATPYRCAFCADVLSPLSQEEIVKHYLDLCVYPTDYQQCRDCELVYHVNKAYNSLQHVYTEKLMYSLKLRCGCNYHCNVKDNSDVYPTVRSVTCPADEFLAELEMCAPHSVKHESKYAIDAIDKKVNCFNLHFMSVKAVENVMEKALSLQYNSMLAWLQTIFPRIAEDLRRRCLECVMHVVPIRDEFIQDVLEEPCAVLTTTQSKEVFLEAVRRNDVYVTRWMLMSLPFQHLKDVIAGAFITIFGHDDWKELATMLRTSLDLDPSSYGNLYLELIQMDITRAVEGLEWMIETTGKSLSERDMNDGYQYISTLVKKGKPGVEQIIQLLLDAKYLNLPMECNWLHDAAVNGQLPLIQLLCTKKVYTFPDDVVDAYKVAKKEGHLEVVTWMEANAGMSALATAVSTKDDPLPLEKKLAKQIQMGDIQMKPGFTYVDLANILQKLDEYPDGNSLERNFIVAFVKSHYFDNKK